MGLMSGKCAFGTGTYRWLKEEIPSGQPLPSQKRPIGERNTLTQQQHDDARAYLKECAAYKKKRGKAQPPFGSPALYAYMRTARGSAVVFSPYWANLYLGIIYLEGIGTGASIEKSRKFFLLANEDNKSDYAERYLALISEKELEKL